MSAVTNRIANTASYGIVCANMEPDLNSALTIEARQTTKN